MMKITTSGHYEQLRFNVLNNQSEFSLKQTQISTGKRFLSRSEETVDAAEAADIKRRDRYTEQFSANAQNTLNFEIGSNGKIEEVVNLLQEALEQTVGAQNGTHPPEYRMNIATAIDSMVEQLLQVSSAKFGEAYLFSGTDTGEEPFSVTRDPVSNQILSVTTNADASTEARRSQIDQNTTIEYGELASGTDGIFQSSTQGVDLFSTLINLRDQMAAGDVPVSADHKDLEDGLDHVISKITASGVKQQWLDSHLNSLLNTRQMNVRQLGLLEDVDIAGAMMEMSQLQATFQASLQMAVRNNQNSILNYI